MEYLEIIEQLRKEADALLPMSEEQERALGKKIRLEFNYNSNHIEGNTLTYSETELLLIFDETRGNHSGREYEEMKASDVTYKMVEDLAKHAEQPLTENFIKNLNSTLLVRPYRKDAITANGERTRREILIGDYKKFSNSVLLDNGEIFNYASPVETPALMGDLIDWFRSEEDKKELHPAELAAQMHYKYVRIHPFDDGNGRISRLLMNYILLKNNYPPVIIKADDKKNYLSALRDADTGNFLSFKDYIAEQLIWSLQLSIKAAKGESLEEEEDWKKQLALIKQDLSDKETIKTVKSPETIEHLINDMLIPDLNKLLEDFKDFDELFLSKSVRVVIDANNIPTLSKTYTFNTDQVKRYFYNRINFEIFYQSFTKDFENPFAAIASVSFNFEEYYYDVSFKDELLFKKLYHQRLDEREIKELKNQLGRSLTIQIENQIKEKR